MHPVCILGQDGGHGLRLCSIVHSVSQVGAPATRRPCKKSSSQVKKPHLHADTGMCPNKVYCTPAPDTYHYVWQAFCILCPKEAGSCAPTASSHCICVRARLSPPPNPLLPGPQWRGDMVKSVQQVKDGSKRGLVRLLLSCLSGYY